MDLNEHGIHCPYCGEYQTVLIDPTEPEQEYIEDCQVCCRPIVFIVQENNDGSFNVDARHENDT